MKKLEMGFKDVNMQIRTYLKTPESDHRRSKSKNRGWKGRWTLHAPS